MKKSMLHQSLMSFLAALLVAGCAASGDQGRTADAAPPAAAPPREAAAAQAPADTVNVSVQKAQKPPYETTDPVKTTLPPAASLKYCVQIGAYKLQENAGVVASLAKSRFAKNVYTIHDPAADLYKVMVGDFATKDDARGFRDRMVQQYPGDYKDAWVSELAE